MYLLSIYLLSVIISNAGFEIACLTRQPHEISTYAMYTLQMSNVAVLTNSKDSVARLGGPCRYSKHSGGIDRRRQIID